MTRYEDIAADLWRRIDTGEFAPGDTLPIYEELAQKYETGRSTITSALHLLEEQGLVQPVKRKGLVVRARANRRRLTRNSTISHTPDGGYRFPAATDGELWTPHGQPTASWEATPPKVAEALGIDPYSAAFRRRRVMSPAGEPPWSVTDTWLPPLIVTQIKSVSERNTGQGGVLRRLEEAGHGPLTWTERAWPAMPGKEEARLLEISRHMPVMEILRTGVSASTGHPVEVTFYTIPSDRIEIETVLSRGPSAYWPLTY